MGRKWTVNSAMRYLSSTTQTTTNGKFLIVEGGVKGLTGCSAADFLNNHGGMNVVFRPKKERVFN